MACHDRNGKILTNGDRVIVFGTVDLLPARAGKVVVEIPDAAYVGGVHRVAFESEVVELVERPPNVDRLTLPDDAVAAAEVFDRTDERAAELAASA